MEALTGLTWRPWPVPRGGLHQSYVEALAGPAEAFTGPTRRPSPALRGGFGRSYVEAFAGRRGGLHRPDVDGPTWRPSPALRGALEVQPSRLHVRPAKAST